MPVIWSVAYDEDTNLDVTLHKTKKAAWSALIKVAASVDDVTKAQLREMRGFLRNGDFVSLTSVLNEAFEGLNNRYAINKHRIGPLPSR